MSKSLLKIKEKAIAFRKTGASIREIAKKLNANKSTVSFWCRDIILSESQLKLLRDRQLSESKKTLSRCAESKRVRRLEKTGFLANLGKKQVGNTNKRDLFISGLSLYWAEGYKKGNDELGFTNSDPRIIKVFIKWLKEIYKIPVENLIFRLGINQIHYDREKEVIRFWSNVCGVKAEQFTKTSFIHSTAKKIYNNYESHFGTLRVKVRRGTDLRRKILGSIEKLAEEL